MAFTAPFTPAHTLKVCPSGCDYPTASAAYAAAVAAHFDNVLIDIHGGVYNECINVSSGTSSIGLGHVWFRGSGGSFAHIECPLASAFHASSDADATPPPMVVIENREFSDGAAKGLIAAGSAGGWPFHNMQFWMRNIYEHDNNDQGVFTNTLIGSSNPHPTDVPRGSYSVKMENVRLARNGSGNGPAHNMYIEASDTFDFLYSWTEASNIGHTLKTRSNATNINCSKMLQSYNPDAKWSQVFGGASAIDFSEGMKTTMSNSIIGWGASVGGNDTSMKWAKDRETVNAYTDIKLSEVYYVGSGNLWLNDGGGYPTYMGPDSFHPRWDPWFQQVPPSASTDETFVGSGSFQFGVNPYFFSYQSNRASLPLRKNSTAYTAVPPPGNSNTPSDVFVVPNNPPGIVFHVITSGTTAASEPAAYATATDKILDGAADFSSLGTVINDGTAVVQAEPENPYLPITGLSMPASRAAAGIPALAGYVGYGDDPVRFPIPLACGSRPVGNVAIP